MQRDEATAPGVPAELARLWRLPTESRRGRPAGLSVERVVRSAVAMADRHGLAALSLAKVAAALDVTTMSLYRYVGSKEELFALMADAAYAPVLKLPEGPPGEWRTGLRTWALAQAEVLREHPWIAQVPVAGPPSGPHQIGWLDTGLHVLSRTPLDLAARLRVLAVISGYVRSTAQLHQDLARGRRAAGVDETGAQVEYGRTLARLVDPERFPDAAALFGSTVFEDDGAGGDAGAQAPSGDEADAAFGLELILDGVAAALREAGDAG